MSSCLSQLNLMQHVLKFTQAERSMTWLGAFGGASLKPLQIWHIHGAFRLLRRTRPVMPNAEKLYTSKDNHLGKRTYSGRKTLMKASQMYPPAFALAVARISYGIAFESRFKSHST
jgi:hypothetical protein